MVMEPRICVFKIAIVSADNVWTASVGKEGSKAAVTLRFPGQEAASVYQSDAVLPSLPNAKADELPSVNQNKADAKKDKDRADQSAFLPTYSVVDSSASLSFPLGAFSDYVRASDWLLWHQLVSDPLRVSLLWISPFSQTTTAVGTVMVDLSELLFSEELCLERDFVVEPVISGEPQVESKQVAPTKKDAPLKAPSKGKKGIAADEVPPSVCPGATMKVQITLDTPILSDEERDESIVMDFSNFCVVKVPPQHAGINTSSSKYSLAFEIPGFTGAWWSNFSIAKQEVKENLSVVRIHGGIVTAAQVDGGQSADLCGAQSVAASSIAGRTSEEATANGDECGNRESLDVITWNASFRRFLPGVAVRELKEDIWKKKLWRGEIAKYSTNDQTSMSYERDHLSGNISLSSLLDEGVSEMRVSSALHPYKINQALLSDKSSSIDNENGSDILTSEWEACSSQLTICVKTSCPLQPAWVAPPKLQLALEDVLPMRPKPPTFADKLEIAVKEFQDLVQVGAQSIFSLQEKVVSENASKLDSPTSEWTYRPTGTIYLQTNAMKKASLKKQQILIFGFNLAYF